MIEEKRDDFSSARKCRQNVKRVKFPLFELADPPCKDPGCDGNRIPTVDLQTKDHFRKCHKCGAITDRRTGQEAYDFTVKTVNEISDEDEGYMAAAHHKFAEGLRELEEEEADDWLYAD